MCASWESEPGRLRGRESVCIGVPRPPRGDTGGKSSQVVLTCNTVQESGSPRAPVARIRAPTSPDNSLIPHECVLLDQNRRSKGRERRHERFRSLKLCAIRQLSTGTFASPGSPLLAPKQRAQARCLPVAARRTLMLCVMLLSFSLNAFIAQTHVHATQWAAAAAHGHAPVPTFESDTREDFCILCQIVSHASAPLLGGLVQLPASPERQLLRVEHRYDSPPLILAHRGLARAPPPSAI